ncbi:MAG: hypothetical protein WBG62_05955, partial [Cyclobacteriaceae bacterium]
MAHHFGVIRHGRMFLNEIGLVAKNEWERTPDIRPDMNLAWGEHVVMPNHFHAILMIGHNRYNACRDTLQGVPTGCGSNLNGPSGQMDNERFNNPGNTFGPQSKNLSSKIRGYKSAVTMGARRMDAGFAWQAWFHDHIIQSDESHDHISQYIQQNPANWMQDRY